MKVLVIDDNPLHQASARQTLAGHDLTIVGTYDEAHKLLQEPHVPYEAIGAELERQGFKEIGADGTTPRESIATYTKMQRLKQELRPPSSFDVVLSDLLMPASKMTMGDKGLKYVGQEMPVGFALSLMAALHGAKYVGVVTDTNHHDHPASAMLDSFASRCHEKNDWIFYPARFVVNGAKVGYYHSPMIAVEGATCPICEGKSLDKYPCKVDHKPYHCNFCGDKGYTDRCYHCKDGLMWGKDWGSVIAHLTT